MNRPADQQHRAEGEDSRYLGLHRKMP
jgi:hypothetical protein